MAHLITRRSALAGGVAAGSATWLGRAGAEQMGTPRRGGTLRYSTPYNPGSLDPLTSRTAGDFNLLYMLYDALIDFDPATLDIRPGLARAWHWADPTTLVLDLVETVTFQDGTPFDADAVKFNLERYKSDPRSNEKGDLVLVDTIEARTPHQVAIHLSKPNAALPTILTDRAGLMVSPAQIKAKGPNIDRAPMGTGPFKLVSWADNDRIIVTRNERYWRPGLPYLDGIDVAIITEMATSLRSVTAGENDLASNLPIQLKTVADREPDLVSVAGANLGMIGVYLNYGRPPLDDLRIRQALNYAVNRGDVNQANDLGLAEPAVAIMPREHWAYDAATANYYTYDPAKARKLLADAGHPDGIDLQWVGWNDQLSVKWEEQVVSQLAEAGIRVKLTTATPNESSVMFYGPTHTGSGRMSAISARPDPSQQYDNLFSKDAYFNAGAVELPGYRELLEATIASTDQATRKAAFAKLQAFVVENALMLPIVFPPLLSVHTARVKGYQFGLIAKPKFAEVWLAG